MPFILFYAKLFIDFTDDIANPSKDLHEAFAKPFMLLIAEPPPPPSV